MSLTSRNPADISTTVSVDRNDLQVVVAVEDSSAGTTSIVAAVDPLVDRQVLAGLVDELLNELDRIHPDAPELVADELLEGSA